MRKFRFGFYLGTMVGFVFGARAGRQRYEQLKRLFAGVRSHPAIHQLTEQATALTDLVRNVVADSLALGADELKKVSTNARG